MAMWYDNGLASVDASSFDFVKISKIISNPC